MPSRKIRGVELYYEVGGAANGSRVLFIGGSGGDLRQRPGVFEGPLAEGHRVLAYDQRGLGRSEIPPGPYSMADYGEDAAALLAQLDFAPCAVIGVSFGGMVAQELACRHPEQVERLVLCCTSSGGAGGASYPLHELADLDDAELLERSLALSDTRMDAAWRRANPDAFERVAKLYRGRGEVGRDEPGREVGARLQLEARRGHDTWGRLPGIERPVLLCGGRYDGIAPPANMEAIAGRLPNARLEMFDGGHLFLVQDQAAWPSILAFLAE